MSTLLLADPTGESFGTVTPEQIATLLESRGEDYWNSKQGAGSGQLYYSERNDEASSTDTELNITKSDQHGIYLCYRGKDGNSYTASVGTMDIRNLVRIFDAQEGFRLLPQCVFIPVNDAIEVVSHYCRVGERTPKVTWLDIYAIPWAMLESETERIKIAERTHRKKVK